MKIPEKEITNLTKLYILVLLHDSPSHGYELISKFEARLEKKLSPGQLYPLLRTMLKNGLVTVEEEYDGKRMKKIYFLTEKGKKLCKELVSTLKSLLSEVV